MALNIPNVGQPGDAFLKGMEGGSNMLQKMMLSRYYGQLHPSGDVANALYLEQIGQSKGYDSPEYMSAKKAFDLGQTARESLIDNRDMLTNTGPVRYTSPTGKVIAEGRGQGAIDIEKRRRQGQGLGVNPVARKPQASGLGDGAPAMHRGQQWYDAEGNPVYPPDAYGEQDGQPDGAQESFDDQDEGIDPEKAEAYERDLVKKTSDPDARRRDKFAQNIDKTIDLINPKSLTQYSGLKGVVRRLNDEYKAQKGDAPKNLKDFQDSMVAAEILADQVRSFYGTSIQPSMIKRLEKLTNPSAWYKTPEIAERNFNSLVKILKSEGETFKDATRSPVKFKRKEVPQKERPNRQSETQTVTIKNRKTGVSETVSIEEARRRGVPNV